MQPKTITAIGGIMLTGLVVITGSSTACIQDGDLLVHPTVVLENQNNAHKVCFELEEDYQIFKKESFRRIHDNPASAGSLGYFGDTDEFQETILMLIEEMERGNIDMSNIDTSGGVNTAVQTRLKSEIDALVDSYGFVGLPNLPDSPFK